MAESDLSLPEQARLLVLMPGDVWCEREARCLGTVLGSCVAVCLWDRHLQFGGMNHFVLPNRPSNGDVSMRFGDVAVPWLIDRMVDLGSSPKHIQAKLFGGGYVLRAGNPDFAVGRRNVETAVSILRHHRIPVVASRVSGTQGLVIRHCTHCGNVWVRPIGKAIKKAVPLTENPELRCYAEGIVAAMIIRDEEGLPLAVRSRETAGGSQWCPTCGDAPFGWRQA